LWPTARLFPKKYSTDDKHLLSSDRFRHVQRESGREKAKKERVEYEFPYDEMYYLYNYMMEEMKKTK